MRALSVALSLLAAFLAFALALPASAQVSRMRGACVNVQIAGGAAFGGMDIQASSSGAGLIISSILVDTAGGVYAARTGGAATLTASIATITPLFAFGPSAPSAVVREGTAPATLGEGAFLLTGTATAFTPLPPIWVGPGQFFTLQRTTTATTLNATVCFAEVPTN